MPEAIPSNEEEALAEISEVKKWLAETQQRNQQAQQIIARGAYLEGYCQAKGWGDSSIISND